MVIRCWRRASRRLLVPLLLEQLEDAEMLLGLLPVAAAVHHAAIGEEPADAVDPAQRVEEERVAGGADDGLVELDATLVQRVRAVGLDSAGQQPQLGRPAAPCRFTVETIARLGQGRGLERHAQAIGLEQGLGRGQHLRELPAIAGAALRPPLLADAAQEHGELHAGQVVALAEIGLRDLFRQPAVQPVVSQLEVDPGQLVLAGDAELVGRGAVRRGDEVAAVPLAREHALLVQQLQRLVYRRARDFEAVGEILGRKVRAGREPLLGDVLEDPGREALR